MKKARIWIIAIIAFIILIGLVIILISAPRGLGIYPQYSCNSNLECVSQCSRGCVNNNWADLNPDNSECFRAWDCSCVNNQCYTDGKPRS